MPRLADGRVAIVFDRVPVPFRGPVMRRAHLSLAPLEARLNPVT
jgi:hypothetical protein